MFSFIWRPENKIFNLLLRLWGHLKPNRKRQFYALVVVMLISSAAEIFSLAAVIPFLSIVTNPKSLVEQRWGILFLNLIGINNEKHALVAFALVFIVLVTLAACIRIIGIWLNSRFAAITGKDLSCQCYENALYENYEIHITRNSSKVIAIITAMIDKSVVAINCVLQLCTSLVIAIGLSLAIITISWKVSVYSILIFVSSYLLIAALSKRRLRANSKVIALNTKLQLKNLQEGLGAIRETILDNTQSTYLKSFENSELQKRVLQAENQFISVFPRYALEAIGIVTLASISLVLVDGESNYQLIGLLGSIALGAQRLLPALQQIYSSWSVVNGYKQDLTEVIEALDNSSFQTWPTEQTRRCLENFKTLTFENISFNYINNQCVISDLNLTVDSGETIGIIGPTGSGKSTFIDLVLGLLVPSKGKIMIDNQNLHSNHIVGTLNSWQSMIAHVPQAIYLTDNTIYENIAFGVPYDDIDIERVKKACSKAKISDFIESLPGQYSSIAGERGVKFSGGQRQRIGIARAFYKQAKLLILDEATSALDNETEALIMDSINNDSEKITILMIAHRLSTLKKCGRILLMENGKIIKDEDPKYGILNVSSS